MAAFVELCLLFQIFRTTVPCHIVLMLAKKPTGLESLWLQVLTHTLEM